MIDRLAQGPASMSELARELGMTLPAVDKHLKILVEGRLVTKEKHGRTTTVRLNPGSLQELATWAMTTQLMWSNLLGRLEQHLTDRSTAKGQP
jgi:DNA-binding transcriptional ArsR family regulator